MKIECTYHIRNPDENYSYLDFCEDIFCSADNMVFYIAYVVFVYRKGYYECNNANHCCSM